MSIHHATQRTYANTTATEAREEAAKDRATAAEHGQKAEAARAAGNVAEAEDHEAEQGSYTALAEIWEREAEKKERTRG